MGHIKVLPDAMINRIAAGEVVERPASVVKELVENSLDAGAESIQVHVIGGGKRSIRVTDDGSGMDRDDALLSLEPHATSKLEAPADLMAIETLGFRGEALSSIAAVSRLVLRTSTRDGDGTEVEVRAGKIASVREIGLPRGTMIQADRLFFNVPARRKFMRTDATELSHIARALTRYALAYHRTRFELTHGERRIVQTQPTQSPIERIAQIHGSSFAAKMLPFDGGGAGLRVHGFAGRPADALSRRDVQHLFVNGRAVLDRVLAHAVSEAYANAVPRGRFPLLVLFLELEAGAVDVNVHPQKTEVRFRDSGQVHDVVRDTLISALSREAAVPELADLRPGRAGPDPRAVARAAAGYLDSSRAGTRRDTGPTGRVLREAGSPRTSSIGAGPASERPAGPTFPETSGSATHGVVPLAQFRESYIVAQDGDGLVLIDQHAAHERVIFERFLNEAEENRVEIQELLFPLTVELAPHEFILLEEQAGEFRRLGFLVEPFGGHTVRLNGIPAVAEQLNPTSLLRELIGEAARARSAVSDSRDLRHRLVTTAACKAAIKINHSLGREGMQALLDDLFRAKNPTTCPHGRPLLFRLTLAEIERAFGRR